MQDAGRWGYQARGVSVAGPMDPVSHRLANALVGNDRAAALLEITLIGPELEFDDERVVAVAGADFDTLTRRSFGAAACAVHGRRGIASPVRSAAARRSRLSGGCGRHRGRGSSAAARRIWPAPWAVSAVARWLAATGCRSAIRPGRTAPCSPRRRR